MCRLSREHNSRKGSLSLREAIRTFLFLTIDGSPGSSLESGRIRQASVIVRKYWFLEEDRVSPLGRLRPDFLLLIAKTLFEFWSIS